MKKIQVKHGDKWIDESECEEGKKCGSCGKGYYNDYCPYCGWSEKCKENKIKKLDFSGILNDKESGAGQTIGLGFWIIENKINEIIDHLNKLT